MKKKRPIARAGTLAVLGFLAVLSFASAADVLLHNLFADGHGTQSLPNRAEWFSAGNAENLTGAPGSMTMVKPVTAFAYFTNANSVVFGEGQKLVLTIRFSIGNAVAGGTRLRVGLMNSNGDSNRMTAKTNGGDSFSPYTGYAVFFNPQTGKNIFRFQKRNAGLDGSLIGSAAAYTELEPNASGGRLFLKNGVEYTLAFTLENLGAQGVSLTANIADPSGDTSDFSAIDATSPHLAFDTIVLGAMTGSFESWTFYEVKLERTGKKAAASFNNAISGTGTNILLGMAAVAAEGAGVGGCK